MAIGESMAQCPECQTEIAEDFGLITCAGCGASLLVDMEGGVASQKEQFEEPVPEEAFEAEEEIADEEVEDAGMSEVESEAYAPAPQYGSDEEFEPSYVEEMSLDPETESETESEVEASLYESEPVSSDMNDVVDFANSDQSQGRDGGLQYTLKLSGIDTMDLRYSIKEALTDKRFIWDLEAMMRGIQDGVLLIEQVSAVKAYIVVSRVAHLPIGISWTQQALSQP